MSKKRLLMSISAIFVLTVLAAFLFDAIPKGTMVGVGFCLFGLAVLYENLSARLRWIKSHGVITRLDFSNERIEYEYDVDGSKHSGKSGNDPNWHQVGQQIQVYYDRHNPAQSLHHSWGAEIVFGWGTAIIGLMLIVLALIG